MTEVEKVARAMCKAGGYDPDEMMPNDGPRWRYYVPGAEAAIAALDAARGESADERPDLDAPLPCDVRLPLVMTLKAGVSVRTLLLAINDPNRPKHFEPETADERAAMMRQAAIDRAALAQQGGDDGQG